MRTQSKLSTELTNLVIKPEELNQLDKLIGDIPTKYGRPLADLLELIYKKRTLEALQRKQKQNTK